LSRSDLFGLSAAFFASDPFALSTNLRISGSFALSANVWFSYPFTLSTNLWFSRPLTLSANLWFSRPLTLSTGVWFSYPFTLSAKLMRSDSFTLSGKMLLSTAFTVSATFLSSRLFSLSANFPTSYIFQATGQLCSSNTFELNFDSLAEHSDTDIPLSSDSLSVWRDSSYSQIVSSDVNRGFSDESYSSPSVSVDATNSARVIAARSLVTKETSMVLSSTVALFDRTPENRGHARKRGISIGAIIGIVVGSLSLIVGGFAWFYLTRKPEVLISADYSVADEMNTTLATNTTLSYFDGLDGCNDSFAAFAGEPEIFARVLHE
jgi:hypothetical protein